MSDDQVNTSFSQARQIESDPEDADCIYVLTEKGLYLSRDAGKSFRLAALAEGRIKAIDRLAVDPGDGRYLYAIVDLGQLYRSSDYGCTWQKMGLGFIKSGP